LLTGESGRVNETSDSALHKKVQEIEDEKKEETTAGIASEEDILERNKRTDLAE